VLGPARRFDLVLEPGQVVYARAYPSVSASASRSWFAVARMDASAIGRIRFGDEGEEWRMAPPAEFLRLDEAVPYLRHRLADYMAAERADRTDSNAV
jgi:8-oxo-dGTP diphosphatase